MIEWPAKSVTVKTRLPGLTSHASFVLQSMPLVDMSSPSPLGVKDQTGSLPWPVKKLLVAFVQVPRVT